MRTITALLAGLLLGVSLTLGCLYVSGGWYTYRAIRTTDDAEIRRVVEQEDCEPFEARRFLFARCARFRLH